MKNLCFIILLSSIILSCDGRDSKVKNHELEMRTETIDSEHPLEGAWELVGYYNYLDNKVIDSFETTKGYRQVKMYTPSRVMWSKHIPQDSTEWFGYGNYTVDGDELTEVLEYGSEMMSKIIEEKKEFKHELIIGNDSFSQIEIDEDGNRIYAENYKRIE
ncbi:MAG: hypothetical protein WA775_01165 [Psychroserpens sp.]|uniref:hypothetical protein n=1 Tax=Psychroserpens sp. TaxID=2020870 RepID=UPI003C9B2842